jgi:hypothetical protein
MVNSMARRWGTGTPRHSERPRGIPKGTARPTERGSGLGWHLETGFRWLKGTLMETGWDSRWVIPTGLQTGSGSLRLKGILKDSPTETATHWRWGTPTVTDLDWRWGTPKVKPMGSGTHWPRAIPRERPRARAIPRLTGWPKETRWGTGIPKPRERPKERGSRSGLVMQKGLRRDSATPRPRERPKEMGSPKLREILTGWHWGWGSHWPRETATQIATGFQTAKRTETATRWRSGWPKEIRWGTPRERLTEKETPKLTGSRKARPTAKGTPRPRGMARETGSETPKATLTDWPRGMLPPQTCPALPNTE